MRVRTPGPAGGCHQCCTSPSSNCRAAARRICAARFLGGAVDQGHHVLELVAEAVGPAGLVERRPAPDPAGQDLVEQPAIEHQVQRGVGRPDLDGPEDAVPSALTSASALSASTGRSVGPNEPPRVFRGLRLPERRRRRPRRPAAAPGARSSARRTGRRAQPGPAGQPLPPESGGRIRRAVAAQELGAVGRERAGTTRHVGEGDAPGEITRPGAAGEQGAALRVERAQDTSVAACSRSDAEHPLGIERRRQPPGPVAGVAHPTGESA